MKNDSLINTGWLAHPYYVRCFDSENATPLNGRRVQYASQQGTTEVDPALPQMIPYTNQTLCMSKYKVFNNEYTNLGMK